MDEASLSRRNLLVIGASAPVMAAHAWQTPRVLASVPVGTDGSPSPSATTTPTTQSGVAATKPQRPAIWQPADGASVKGEIHQRSTDPAPAVATPLPGSRSGLTADGQLPATGGVTAPVKGFLVASGAAVLRVLLRRSASQLPPPES